MTRALCSSGDYGGGVGFAARSSALFCQGLRGFLASGPVLRERVRAHGGGPPGPRTVPFGPGTRRTGKGKFTPGPGSAGGSDAGSGAQKRPRASRPPAGSRQPTATPVDATAEAGAAPRPRWRPHTQCWAWHCPPARIRADEATDDDATDSIFIDPDSFPDDWYGGLQQLTQLFLAYCVILYFGCNMI